MPNVQSHVLGLMTLAAALALSFAANCRAEEPPPLKFRMLKTPLQLKTAPDLRTLNLDQNAQSRLQTNRVKQFEPPATTTRRGTNPPSFSAQSTIPFGGRLTINPTSPPVIARPGTRPVTLPGGALLWRQSGEFQDTRNFEIDPKAAKQSVIFSYSVSKVPNANAVHWQISRLGYPAFDNGSATNRNPPGLVMSGIAQGRNGWFEADFAKLKQKLPPSGQPFSVRVLPIASAQNPAIVGQPSNVIGVYYGNMPASPPVKINVPKTPAPTKPPLMIKVTLDYLYCYESNEYNSGDVSIDANVGPGDEPYLLANGFSLKSGRNWKMANIPMFKGVKNNGGGHGPCGTVIGVDGKWVKLAEDDVAGFHAILMEWDESDATKRYAGLEKFTGVMGSVVSIIATDGAAASNPATLKAAYNTGAEIGRKIPQFLEVYDPDDCLGDRSVLLTAADLRTQMQTWFDAMMKEAKGGGSVLNQNGQPVSFIVKPWLDPRAKPDIDLPGSIEFKGDGARYKLTYTVWVQNPWYTGKR